jgi:hypothetical protein
LEKELDKEWLKPARLAELGGEAARDKVEREMREQKYNSKK